MTYTVSGGALNSTPTKPNQSVVFRSFDLQEFVRRSAGAVSASAVWLPVARSHEQLVYTRCTGKTLASSNFGISTSAMWLMTERAALRAEHTHARTSAAPSAARISIEGGFGRQVLSVGKQFNSAACSGGLGVNTQHLYLARWWLGRRVVSVLDSGAEGPGFKSQPRRRRVTNCSHPSCLCSPSSKTGSSSLKGCGGNCGPGGK